MVAAQQSRVQNRFTVVYTIAARAWLSKQTEFTRRHVCAAIQAASFNPYALSTHLYRQWIWQVRTNGKEARRIKILFPRPGVRAICYISDSDCKLVIIKIDWRDNDPYEDQG